MNLKTFQPDIPLDIMVGKRTFDLRVSSDFDELADMQGEWDKFIESIKGEIFLTYDWCRIWWKYYGKGRELLILIFRRYNEICAILPMFRETIWLGPVYIRAVKIVGTDFIPVTMTVPIKNDFMIDITQSFIDQLKKRWSWDILHIGPICGRYDSFDDLFDAFRKTGIHKADARIRKNDVQTYFKIANNWEEQVANLVKSEQKNIRKKYQRLLKEGIIVKSVLANSQNILEVFDNFVQVHQSYWQELGKAGHFVAWPSSYEFHREVSDAQFKKGRLRLNEIMVDNKCIGFSYRYKYGNTYYCFLSARNQPTKYDFKLIEFAESVKNAQIEDVNYLDSMRGVYDYKLRLGCHLLPIKNLFVISNGVSSLVRVTCFRFLASVLDICYVKLWRRRIAPRIKVKVGEFWRIWLRTNILSY